MMDAISAPTAPAILDGHDRGDNMNEVAMQLLSLKADNVTDDGEDEKDTDGENDETVNILPDHPPSSPKQDVPMDEDTQTTPKNDHIPLDPQGDTNGNRIAMDEDTPVADSNANADITEVLPTCDPLEQVASPPKENARKVDPLWGARGDELTSTTIVGNGPADPTPQKSADKDDPFGAPGEASDSTMTVEDKSKSPLPSKPQKVAYDNGGWGDRAEASAPTTAVENTSDAPTPTDAGTWNSTAANTGWGSNTATNGSSTGGSWATSGGDTWSSANGKTQDDFGNREFGRGRGGRGRGRGHYEDWDSPRKTRPPSFGGGFDTERKFGHARFASGSNDVPVLLTPLGRGRASPMKGGRFEPYPTGGRRDARSTSGSGDGLDYTDDGRFDDTVVQSQAPTMLPYANFGEADRLSDMMNGPDVTLLKKKLTTHLKNLQKHQEKCLETLHAMKRSHLRYEDKKRKLDESLNAETDPEKRLQLAETREKHRSDGFHDSNILQASMKLGEAAVQGEIDALLQTVGDALGNKIQSSVLGIVHALSAGNGDAPPHDISPIIERCLMKVAPKLLRDLTQIGAQKRLEQKQAELEEELKAKDSTILELTERLNRIEAKLEFQSSMANNTLTIETDATKTTGFWFFRR